MLLGEFRLLTDLLLDDVEIKVRADPSNPVLDLALASATVDDGEVDGSGNVQLNLAPISQVYRINAPQNTALNSELAYANVMGASKDGATFVFLIDK